MDKVTHQLRLLFYSSTETKHNLVKTNLSTRPFHCCTNQLFEISKKYIASVYFCRSYLITMYKSCMDEEMEDMMSWPKLIESVVLYVFIRDG